LDTGYWIQYIRYRLLDTRYWIQDTGYWIQDTGYRILDTGYWIQDTGYRIQDTEYSILQIQDTADLGSIICPTERVNYHLSFTLIH